MLLSIDLTEDELRRLRGMMSCIYLNHEPRITSKTNRELARRVGRKAHRTLYPERFVLTAQSSPATLLVEHSLSTPEQQANLLTRIALRNGIDASTIDAVASNLRSLEKIWFLTYLRTLADPPPDKLPYADLDAYHKFRAAAIASLLESEK
jgi:hypothetical protein